MANLVSDWKEMREKRWEPEREEGNGWESDRLKRQSEREKADRMTERWICGSNNSVISDRSAKPPIHQLGQSDYSIDILPYSGQCFHSPWPSVYARQDYPLSCFWKFPQTHYSLVHFSLHAVFDRSGRTLKKNLNKTVSKAQPWKYKTTVG